MQTKQAKGATEDVAKVATTTVKLIKRSRHKSVHASAHDSGDAAVDVDFEVLSQEDVTPGNEENAMNLSGTSFSTHFTSATHSIPVNADLLLRAALRVRYVNCKIGRVGAP